LDTFRPRLSSFCWLAVRNAANAGEVFEFARF
jgi:hypothetical protein